MVPTICFTGPKQTRCIKIILDLSYEDMKGAGIDKIRHLFRNYERGHVYDYEEHVSFAEELEAYGKLPKTFMAVDPVSKKPWIWDDVTRMRTLNTKQSQKKRQNHICPLNSILLKD